MNSLPPRYTFGRVAMSCVDLQQSLDVLFSAASSGRGGYIACTCTHGIVESDCDERLRHILNDSLLTLPDGMPTVWMGRAKGMPVRRVTAPDFLEAALVDLRAKNLRHYFYGASDATVGRIVERATGALGRDAIAGCYAPRMRVAGAPEDPGVLSAMAHARPHIIWVGLGLPKQEYWMERYSSYFPNAVMVGVGAAFDWYAGDKARAPKSLQMLGLEWLHRVACEPRRLWPRYRVVVPRALGVMARDLCATATASLRRRVNARPLENIR
jgi:N-acetylglucosaminyldiphosphoundecaprenol N-acetyl-beta-D-mannosaminyltransferase